jgi:hypothetical protein
LVVCAVADSYGECQDVLMYARASTNQRSQAPNPNTPHIPLVLG